MAKWIFFLVLIIISSLSAISQTQKYFEGKIIYKFSFKGEKIPNSDELTSFFGNGSTLYFKEGNYRHEYDGGLMEFDLYKKEENKIYLKKRDNDTIYWTDCSTTGDSIQNLLHSAKSDTVLGIICDRLLVQYKNKSEAHYYNTDIIKTNPDWFENFKLDQEYLIDRKEQSISLKIEYHISEFIFIETASKVSPESIDFEKFKLPNNAILIPE